MATGKGNLPNPNMAFTPFDILLAAELNDFVENIEALAAGTGIGDGSVGTSDIANTAVTSQKIDFGGAGAGVWWEEIGRNTISTPGNTITVSSLPARKYLKIIVLVMSTGPAFNIGALMRFNNDSANNYTKRSQDNYGTPGTPLVSQSSVSISAPTTINTILATNEVLNFATQEKTFMSEENLNIGNGATNSNVIAQYSGKWVNATNQINRVDIINNGASNYAAGSEVIILGHN